MTAALIRLLQETKDDLVWIVTGNGFMALSEGERGTIHNRIRMIEDGIVAFNLATASTGEKP